MIMQATHKDDVDSITQFEFLKLLTEQADSSVMITDAPHDQHAVILHVNEAFTRLTGYDYEEVVGKSPKLLQGPKTDKGVLQRLRQDLTRKGTFRGTTYNYRNTGDEFLMEWEIVPFGDANGSKRYYVTVQRRAHD